MPGNNHSQHHILIVEDNSMMQTFYKNVFREMPFNIRFVSNGADALRYLVEQVPDLILMDINMPKLDGVATTKQIRDDRRLENVPILAVTARQMDEYTMHAGFTAHLKKPLRADDLKDAVCKQLGIQPD